MISQIFNIKPANVSLYIRRNAMLSQQHSSNALNLYLFLAKL